MAEFIYRTEATLSGPWLVDTDRLEALDKILDDEWERLAKRNREAIQNELDKRIEDSFEIRLAKETEGELSPTTLESIRKQVETSIRNSYGYKENRKVTIFYEGDRRVEVESFQEATRQSSLLEGIPVRFDVEGVCGDISFEINIDKYRGALNISTSPETVSEAKELFAALHRWGATNRPPKWQQIWKTWNGIQWAFWLIAVCGGLIAVVIPGNPYKAQARELVRNGVSQENQQRALELLLAMQSDYRPEQDPVLPAWYLLLLFGGLVVCLVTSFIPKSILGIGKGQDRIKLWRLWFGFVFYLVPSFVFLNIIWPLISARVLPK